MLTLCLGALALASAMPQGVFMAKEVAKVRLQDLSSEVMEEIVNLFRLEVASRSALEIAQFLDQSTAGSVRASGADCNQDGDKVTCCVDFSFHVPIFGNIAVKACFIGEYLPDELGVRVQVIVNGNTLIDETLSARNPPPICVKVPDIPGKVLSLCLDASDLGMNGDKFHGCFALKAEALHISVLDVDLGCYDF